MVHGIFMYAVDFDFDVVKVIHPLQFLCLWLYIYLNKVINTQLYLNVYVLNGILFYHYYFTSISVFKYKKMYVCILFYHF